MPNNKDLRELIEATRQHINLREAVIEKDYYVTQVIHQLSGVENEYFRLVFCGGTCLAKAHKLVQRMSEDVDFKIHLKTNNNFNKSRLKSELKKFREQIRSTLVLPDLTITNDVTRNEGRYQQISLKYPSSFPSDSVLRADIKVEFTFSDILLATNELPIKTLIEETLSQVKLFTPTNTNCISIPETAIEKWVGLTRRIIAIDRGYEADDKSLIRHVYDLNSIHQNNEIHPNLIELTKTVINSDGKQFKNQHPEYADNPGSEILQSLAILKDKPLWKKRYDEFIEAMMYDDSNASTYEQSIKAIDDISDDIITELLK